MNLVERDRKVLWHPYTQEKTAPLPIAIVRGEGVWLFTEDGSRILDGISSWWVNIHGHSHPFLNDALAKQASRLEHTMFAGFTHEPAVELAEKLVAITPENLSRVFYSDNGSTAVEVALKMAYQFWQNRGEERKTFVALTNAYHGDTFGAMAASDESSFTKPFQNLLFRVLRAESPYTYDCKKCDLSEPLAVAGGLTQQSQDLSSNNNDSKNSNVSDANLQPPATAGGSDKFRRIFKKCNLSCAQSLETILEQNRGEIAAVIIEPMLQGAGGMIVWKAEFLRKVRELCDKYDVLLIADEVLTGFGRTGKMFACQHANVLPDMMCLSKALTAGYLPLGVTLATEEIYEAFFSDDRAKTFFHGHSFTANPLSCAVASASLELFERENSLEKVAFINRKFQDFFPKLAELKCVGEVRVIGAIGIVELNTGEGYLAEIGQKLYREFLRRNILLRPLGNVLYFMPPYVISENELDWVLSEIADVLQKL